MCEIITGINGSIMGMISTGSEEKWLVAALVKTTMRRIASHR